MQKVADINNGKLKFNMNEPRQNMRWAQNKNEEEMLHCVVESGNLMANTNVEMQTIQHILILDRLWSRIKLSIWDMKLSIHSVIQCIELHILR